MAKEYRLNYTAEEIEAKLGVIDGTKTYYTSEEVDEKISDIDVGESFTAGDGIEIKDGVIRSTLTFDDVPIKDSNSLITSGTIYDIIGDINSVIDSINTLIGGEFE